MNKQINFMISPNILNQISNNIVVIDVRSPEEYSLGHIYNAVNVPEIFTYFPESMNTDKEKLEFIKFYEDIFSKAGVTHDKFVVFYENKFTLESPRGLTILKYLGFDENNIRVLDGGYYEWCEKGLKTSTVDIKNRKENFIADIDKDFFVYYYEMLNFIYDEEVTILDVRDRDEWLGESSSPYGVDFAPKKGRLPNAIWIEWYKFIRSDMLSVEYLDKITFELRKKDINIDDNIVLYCFKGARVSNTYIALRKLGYSNIRIYFAGWNEWCRKENAPIINEVQSKDNPLLSENIALQKKLDKINLSKASLIDFPKYNKEPIFAFDRDGYIDFENGVKKVELPNIRKLKDIFSDITIFSISKIIDNGERKATTIMENEKYFYITCIGSKDSDKVLCYAFDTTEINILNNTLDAKVKEKTAELKEQKDSFENLYQKSYDGVLIMEDGKFVDCNESILKMLKYKTKVELLSKSPSELSPEFQPDGKTSKEKAIEMIDIAIKKGSNTFEWVHLKSDGEEFWAEVVLTKMINKDIDIIHVAWRDISKRKQIEKELEQLSKNLEIRVHEEVEKNKLKDQQIFQQSRLAQMGEMISMIAHQWRQPLTSISNISYDLQLKLQLETFNLNTKEGIEDASKYFIHSLEDVNNAIFYLTNTIDDFRNFYKPNKIMINMKVQDVIIKTLKIIKASLRNDSIEVIEEYNDENKVKLYDHELMQVILNLLKNSQDNFKDIKKKGKYIKIFTDDKHISICDNGGGISEDILEKIFDPYFSTKSEKNGTGLGLYMSKTIIDEHHKGSLEVTNTQDGVCFKITLGV